MRVLSIDGGGLRALLPARILVELEELTATPIAELFDVIAATSSGAFLALGLAAPGNDGAPLHRAEDLHDLLLARGREFLPGGWADRLRELLAPHRRVTQARDRLLDDCLGDVPLGEARSEVVVPAFDLNSGQSLVFRSGEFAGHSSPLMKEVVCASSAMPNHVPPVQMQLGASDLALVDGGVAANNPAIFGYATALSSARPEEITLVSLGTGGPVTLGKGAAFAPAGPTWPRGSRGAFVAFARASSDAQHEMLDELLGGIGNRQCYWRIQGSLVEGGPEQDEIEQLRRSAEAMLEENRHRVGQIAKELLG